MNIIQLTDEQKKNLKGFMGRVQMTGAEALAWIEIMNVLASPQEVTDDGRRPFGEHNGDVEGS